MVKPKIIMKVKDPYNKWIGCNLNLINLNSGFIIFIFVIMTNSKPIKIMGCHKGQMPFWYYISAEF